MTEAEPEAYEGWTVREQSRIQLSRKSAGAHCHKMVFVRVGGVGMIISRTTLFGIAASALVGQQETANDLNVLASGAAGLEPITVTQASPRGLS